MPAYHIPNGPRNLSTLFPTVTFADVEEYYVELKSSGGATIATTTRNWLKSCCDDKIRLFFMNSSGMMDAINAKWLTEDLDIKADQFKKGLPVIFDRTAGGNYRNNIEAGTIRKACITGMEEKDMRWLAELFVSPLVWLEDSSTQNFIPVMLLDTKLPTRRDEDRFDYQTEFSIKLSNDIIIQRT